MHAKSKGILGIVKDPGQLQSGLPPFFGPFPHFDDFISYFFPKFYWLFPGFPHNNNTLFQAYFWRFPQKSTFYVKIPQFTHFGGLLTMKSNNDNVNDDNEVDIDNNVDNNVDNNINNA